MSRNFNLEGIGKPTRLLVIGDSNVLPFTDLLLEDTESQILYQSNAIFLRGLRGHLFSDDNGNLNSSLLKALVRDRILTPSGQAICESEDPRDYNIAFAASAPQQPTPILMHCGDIDCRSRIMKELQDKYDFEVPDHYGLGMFPSEQTSNLQKIPFKQVLPLFLSSVDRFISGLQILSQMGLSDLSIHCVPPPTKNDELFLRVHEFHCPLSTRYKVSRLYNQLLKERCLDLGIPFIDIWPIVTGDDGMLLPEREFDGVHLSRSTARDSLNAWLTAVSGRTHIQFNKRLWKLTSHEDASETFRPQDSSASSDDKVAKATGTSGVVKILSLDNISDFRSVEQNTKKLFIRPEWCSDSILLQGNDFRFHKIDSSQSKQLFELLYHSDIANLVTDHIGFDFICYNALILKGEDHSELLLGQDCGPSPTIPGNLYKLALFFTKDDESGEAQLLVKTSNQEEKHAIKNGLSVIFGKLDGKVLVETGKQDYSCLLLWIGIRVRGMPRIVIHGGLNCWPADPFQYSVSGLNDFPDLKSEHVSIHPTRHIYNVI